MLQKIETVDHIEIAENGTVQVRTKITIFDGDQKLSEVFHRHCVVPGVDYSAEDARVSAICAVTHTPEVVQAFRVQAFRAAKSRTI